jgi:hypothetical protein
MRVGPSVAAEIVRAKLVSENGDVVFFAEFARAFLRLKNFFQKNCNKNVSNAGQKLLGGRRLRRAGR